MDFKELSMNAKELAELFKAFILALDEVLDYDRLQEATIKHYGPITDDQREAVKAFILGMKNSTMDEKALDEILKELNIEALCEEMLQTETELTEEPEEPAE